MDEIDALCNALRKKDRIIVSNRSLSPLIVVALCRRKQRRHTQDYQLSYEIMNSNYYCIIMSGGVGSRFWPQSSKKNPKQFIDFFGTGRSLLQSTYDRFARFIPNENIYIVTHIDYLSHTLKQLPQINPEQVLCEPNRRNTAPCIAYASYRIRQKNPDACMVVAASDHLILDDELFRRSVTSVLDFVAHDDHLVTLGIKPSRPETGYGYIQMGGSYDEGFINVKTFTEKPNAEMAQLFVDSGEFLWNSGMFVWNSKAITTAFETYLPDIAALFNRDVSIYGTPDEESYIREVYDYCPAISIDYALMEKADNVLVYPSDFGWADLGTWGSLYELSEKDDQDNATPGGTRALFYEAKNNIVHLDNDKQVAVIQGIEDCIISQKGNVLLICRKDEEQRIKSFVLDAALAWGDEYV